MLFQKLVGRCTKADAYIDVAELATGITLVGFVWTHMLFVSSVLFGTGMFNNVPAILDATGISYVGIFIVLVAILVHMAAAGRRIPIRWSDQQIVWSHARRLGHKDTWTWLFQVVTGILVLILASIHIWAVLSGWPINAHNSASRVQGGYFWLYLLLLGVAEIHAGVGVYRMFVKWGWIPRQKVSRVLLFVTCVIVGLGIASLLVLMFLVKVGGM